MASGNTGVVKELSFSEGPVEVWEEGPRKEGRRAVGRVLVPIPCRHLPEPEYTLVSVFPERRVWSRHAAPTPSMAGVCWLALAGGLCWMEKWCGEAAPRLSEESGSQQPPACPPAQGRVGTPAPLLPAVGSAREVQVEGTQAPEPVCSQPGLRPAGQGDSWASRGTQLCQRWVGSGRTDGRWAQAPGVQASEWPLPALPLTSLRGPRARAGAGAGAWACSFLRPNRQVPLALQGGGTCADPELSPEEKRVLERKLKKERKKKERKRLREAGLATAQHLPAKRSGAQLALDYLCG